MRPSLGIDVAAPSELVWDELIDNWPHAEVVVVAGGRRACRRRIRRRVEDKASG